ncbi:Phytochelatin synthase [Corchorus capsularis]|uniref:glutathione gamma-glutamylcysteinyltransferase n=1 Tax=Corchorus capsularis TaxID=210143 RepID=A0A1R3K7M7_COCAP|nr:Phytochelatin synthase [Corchorus capsularis]
MNPQLFAEALAGGTAEGFFKLISYYQTQSEPAYCGLATLAIVLNALAIDPGRTWKGPWRWFDDSMLDCCEPLEKIKAQGITFGKVACLAVCNGAQVETFRTDQSSLEDFRKHVISSTSSQDRHLIVSYHRGAFKQVHGYFKASEGDIDSLYYAPADLREVIKSVAEIRRQNDSSSISEEEKRRLNLKEQVLKQVQETELFKHVTRYLAFESSLCENVSHLVCKDKLSDIAAKVCCQGAELLTGKIRSSNGLCCKETNVKLIEAEGDGLAVLLLALPQDTWLSLQEEKLQAKMKDLTLVDSLPTLLQEEVMHLQRQLHFLKANHVSCCA